jgi:hypothetical protein
MQDADFLAKTFTGSDIVYCMQAGDRNKMMDANYTFEELLNDVNLIFQSYKQAILNSGVKKVIHLSSIGADKDNGNGVLLFHYNAEQILKSLPENVSIKHIRPVGFYSNLLANTQIIKQLSKGFVGGIMALRFYGLGGLFGGKRGAIVSNYGGKDVVPWVSPLDIATAIIDETGKPFNGRTVRYVASEELSCNEVAKILGEAIGKPYLKWGLVSDKQLKNAMVGMKMNPSIAQSYVEMNAAHHTGKLFEDYYKNHPTLGITKLKDFAKQFAAAYNS